MEAFGKGGELIYSGGSLRKKQRSDIKQAKGGGEGQGGGDTMEGRARRKVHGEFLELENGQVGIKAETARRNGRPGCQGCRSGILCGALWDTIKHLALILRQ